MVAYIDLSDAVAGLTRTTMNDLLDLAIDGMVTLLWVPSNFEGLSVTPLKAVDKISELTGENITLYKKDTSKASIDNQRGPLVLDPDDDDRWPAVFQVLKDGMSLDFVLQPLDPPLRFRRGGEPKAGLYAAYTDHPYDFHAPKLSDLYIYSSDLTRVRKIMRERGSRPIVRDLGIQRVNAINLYIDSVEPEQRSKPAARGKRGFKDEVWQNVRRIKKEDDSLLFAKKNSSSPDKSIFTTAWKARLKTKK